MHLTSHNSKNIMSLFVFYSRSFIIIIIIDSSYRPFFCLLTPYVQSVKWKHRANKKAVAKWIEANRLGEWIHEWNIVVGSEQSNSRRFFSLVMWSNFSIIIRLFLCNRHARPVVHCKGPCTKGAIACARTLPDHGQQSSRTLYQSGNC